MPPNRAKTAHNSGSRLPLGFGMSIAFRIYGFAYIFSVAFLHSDITTLVTLRLGKLAGYTSVVLLAIVGAFGIFLFIFPNKFHRFAARPFYVALTLIFFFALFKYILPAIL